VSEVERHQQHPPPKAVAPSVPPTHQHCDDVPGKSIRPYDQPFFDGWVGAAVLVEEGVAWPRTTHETRALRISTEPSGVAVENPISVGLTCVIIAVADV
jgi:hypothetical protein